MNDKFEYVHYQDNDETFGVAEIVETALSFLALALCLVGVMALWLCG